MYSKTLSCLLIVQLVVESSFVFANLEDLHQASIKACHRNGLDDKLDLLQNGFNEFTTCSQRTLNITVIVTDMVQSKLEGRVAEMSARQCSKSSEAKSCIEKLMDAVNSCLEAKGREEINLLTTMYDRALDFACYSNGRYLTDFVEMNGLECVASKSVELQQCFDALDNVETKEVDLDVLANCLVTSMARCRLIPAAILSRMYNYMRLGTEDTSIAATTVRAIFIED